jgi:hypothetical protein
VYLSELIGKDVVQSKKVISCLSFGGSGGSISTAFS